MRIRGLTLWLSLLAGLGAGCTSRSGGALTVSWTFSGGTCEGAAVEQVRIAIGGEQLQQDTFDCRSGLVTFTDFYPGTYNVTVQGLDSDNAVTWTGSNSVRLDGDVSVRVDLAPVSQANAVAYFSWTLDPATGDANQIPRCGAGQRLDEVHIYVDDQDQGRYGCEQGLGSGLVITPYLTPGPHTVNLVAQSSQDPGIFFAESGPQAINFVTGRAQSQTVALHWDVGGLLVGWAPYASVNDYNQDIRQSCAQAGIGDLVLGFAGGQNSPGGGAFALGSNCNASATLDNVYAGTWAPYIDACAPGGTAGQCGAQGAGTIVYREAPSLVQPQMVTVQPGKFFDSNDAAAYTVFIPLFHI